MKSRLGELITLFIVSETLIDEIRDMLEDKIGGLFENIRLIHNGKQLGGGKYYFVVLRL